MSAVQQRSEVAPAPVRMETIASGILPGDGPFWDRLPPPERAFEVPGGIVLQKPEDVRAALREPRLRSYVQASLEADPTVDPAFIARRKEQLLSMEGGDHIRLRRLTMLAITPNVVATYREKMRAIMRSLTDLVRDGEEFEAVEAILRPYPIPVVCSIMGVPLEDTGFFMRVAADWTAPMHEGSRAAPKSFAAHLRMDDYLAPILESRQSKLGNDMLSHLLRAEEDGDKLTRREIINMIGGFLAAGTDTTRFTIGSGLYLLAKNPEQWELLRRDPSLIAGATEEILRLAPAGALIYRTAAADVDVNGILIRKGSVVAISLIAVNRDGSVFEDPDRFDITRKNGSRHLAFGFGPHTCLGLHLAKAEIDEALRVVTQQFKSIEICGDVEWTEPVALQGPTKLPIKLRAA